VNYRAVLFLAREDLRLLLRSKETWLWTFLMPVVFFYFMGMMLGEWGRPPGSTEELAVVVPDDAGFLADELAGRLLEQHLDARTVREPTDAPGERRLVVPSGLTAAVLAGEPRELRWIGGSHDVAADHDRVRAEAAVYTVLADLFVLRAKGQAPTASAFAALRETPRSVTLDVRAAGHRRNVPRGFQQSVPGTLVMFTLLALLTNGAALVTIERRRGLLARLASAPLSRVEVVLGKLGGKLLLAAGQILFASIAGSVLFGVSWAHGPAASGALVLLLAVYGVFASALGMCVGNLARTEGQAVGIGVLVANLLASLGGCWWPIEVTPLWMQRLAGFLPTGWVMHALHDLSSLGAGPASVASEVALLSAATVAAILLAARTFRFR
jgi:ABC-type Na+ efflux pump permease subunit